MSRRFPVWEMLLAGALAVVALLALPFAMIVGVIMEAREKAKARHDTIR